MEAGDRKLPYLNRMHLTMPASLLSVRSVNDLRPKPAVSPGLVQETMRLSKAEIFWKFMHTDDYPEPVLPELRLSSLPHSASAVTISSLTQRANQMLESQQTPEDWNMMKTYSANLHATSTRFPNESDFKRAMEKLGRVYAQGGVDSLKMSFQEGRSHELLLDANDRMCARVNLMGQLCPLVITVSRTRGRLVAFVSRTVQEPMELLCDTKFTGDRIWISDPGVRFRSPTIYISFHALEEATFTVNVQFGTKKRVIKEKWKSVNISEKDDEWTQLFGNFVENKPKLLKDFISINKNVIGKVSPELISSQIDRSNAMDNRRREARSRWKGQLEMKRKKALDVLNKQEIKAIERQQQLEVAQKKAAIGHIQKKWLKMIFSFTQFENFLNKFNQRKADIEIETQRIAAVRKLQRAYWKYTKKSSNRQLGYWKAAARRQKKRFEQLLTEWNTALTTAINLASKKKPVMVRGKKSKENPVSRYINISTSAKNQVLGQHFRSARRKFIEEIHEYRLRGWKNESGEAVPPVFHFAPSGEDIMKMVEKAADHAQPTPD